MRNGETGSVQILLNLGMFIGMVLFMGLFFPFAQPLLIASKLWGIPFMVVAGIGFIGQGLHIAMDISRAQLITSLSVLAVATTVCWFLRGGEEEVLSWGPLCCGILTGTVWTNDIGLMIWDRKQSK